MIIVVTTWWFGCDDILCGFPGHHPVRLFEYVLVIRPITNKEKMGVYADSVK